MLVIWHCVCSVFGMSFEECGIVGKLSRAWYCRSGFGSDLPLLAQQLSTRARISLPVPLTVPMDKRFFLGQSNLILASQFLPLSPLIQSPTLNCVYSLSMRAVWWTKCTFCKVAFWFFHLLSFSLCLPHPLPFNLCPPSSSHHFNVVYAHIPVDSEQE